MLAAVSTAGEFPLRLRGLYCCLLVLLALSGCASTNSAGRSRLTAPGSVGIIYSEMEMQAQLAMAADSVCEGKACEVRAAFRRQVYRLGTRLSYAAYREFPDLKSRVYNFYFSVPAKEELGTLSSAGGTVAAPEGLCLLAPAEPALSFILAREMGHVIAEHHAENSANALLVSAATTLLLPATALMRGATAAAPAATTAASLAGTRVVKSLYRPEQNREADAIGLLLAVRSGYRVDEISVALEDLAPRLREEGWMAELLSSRSYLDAVLTGPPVPPPEQRMAAAGDEGGPPTESLSGLPPAPRR